MFLEFIGFYPPCLCPAPQKLPPENRRPANKGRSYFYYYSAFPEGLSSFCRDLSQISQKCDKSGKRQLRFSIRCPTADTRRAEHRLRRRKTRQQTALKKSVSKNCAPLDRVRLSSSDRPNFLGSRKDFRDKFLQSENKIYIALKQLAFSEASNTKPPVKPVVCSAPIRGYCWLGPCKGGTESYHHITRTATHKRVIVAESNISIFSNIAAFHDLACIQLDDFL